MNYKKFLLKLLSILILFQLGFVWNINYSLAEVHSLTILHTNDVHGRLKPVKYHGKEDAGGFAARAKLIEEIKSGNENVLILDAGDIAQGTLFFKFFNGVPDVQFMSEVGYDAAELGNHEFDKGLTVLEKMALSANFPFLCSNIKFLDNPELQKRVKPYIIKDYNGFKVAVIGVITQELKVLTGSSNKIEVLDPVETTKKIIKEIGPKADLIVLLSHSGIKEDIRIAKAVPEINIIVGGHTHTFLRHTKRIYHGKKLTLIVQDGEFGMNLGHLDLKFEDKKIEKYNYELIPVNGKDDDPVFRDKVNELSKQIASIADQKIGKISTPIDARSYKIKSQLTNAGTLIAQSVKSQCPDVDVVLINAGSIRSNKIIEAGDVTKGEIFELHPFENCIMTAEIKGSTLKSVLETSSRFLPNSSEAFMQSLGIEYSVNTAKPAQILSKDGLHILKEGQRVIDIKINGKLIEPDKYYKVAVSDFIFGGGDGYSQFRTARNAQNTGILIQDLILNYIKKNSPVAVEVKDKINLY